METIDYGICRLSLIGVRAEPSDKAELVTQLLFGEFYQVTETSIDGKWLRIQNHADDMTGWIDQKQHHMITAEYYEQLKTADYKISTELVGSLLINKNRIPVLMGSIIPIYNQSLFGKEEHIAFDGETKSVAQRREDWDFLKQLAVKFKGAPYLWGGKSPFGVDCSGFVQVLYKVCGYQLKRDSHQQALQGQEVSFDEVIPGDLVFFAREGKVYHVGIAYDGDGIIHASGTVRIDHLTEEGIIHSESEKLTHELFRIKRLMS